MYKYLSLGKSPKIQISFENDIYISKQIVVTELISYQTTSSEQKINAKQRTCLWTKSKTQLKLKTSRYSTSSAATFEEKKKKKSGLTVVIYYYIECPPKYVNLKRQIIKDVTAEERIKTKSSPSVPR